MSRVGLPLCRQILLGTLLALGACGNHKVSTVDTSKPIVVGIKSHEVALNGRLSRALEIPGTGAARSKAQISEVTLSKETILNRTFLYGSDLQYSSITEAGMDLTLQSLAMGHEPVLFRIQGAHLQLVADQHFLFESDVNHPERLIQDFAILRQDAETVTIVVDKASPVLATVMDNAKAGAPRTTWVRSVDFVAEGNYLMMETSIESANGQIGEFMESIFPRDTLVPADYKPILADADLEPLAARYRFLSWGPVYMDLESGRTKTQVAVRYNVKAGSTIDWYVTPNVPEKFMGDLKTAIEGWNRYSRAMNGTDLVRFLGKLPEGVKIGDPRYNVVNWDNIADAGAAYESQASDPMTGIQSHSLIYLPLAWVNIGKAYWKNGRLSDGQEGSSAPIARLLKSRTFLGRALPVNCLQDAISHIALEARQDPESFSHELLKGVLFHEMGHALGLAHNFKGSLSFEPDAASPVFSTSIMDYNHYHLERKAFAGVDSADGPLLEYDRQIISQLYNEGKDVKATDPELPACEDGEADSLDGGADPLCLRYDAGKDPTRQLVKSLELITDENAVSERTQSLPHAINASAAEFGDATTIATLEAAKAKVKALETDLKGLVGFYVGSGAQSLNYLTRINLHTLYVLKAGILPQGYVEKEMRDRVLRVLDYVSFMEKLSPATTLALAGIRESAKQFLKLTPAIQALPATEQEAALAELMKPLIALDATLEKGLLMKVRTRVIGSLARSPKAPFFMDASGNQDLELLTLALLERLTTSTLADGKTRALEERVAYATALTSYRDIDAGVAAIARVKSKLNLEISQARDAVQREQLRTLVKKLDAAPAPAEG